MIVKTLLKSWATHFNNMALSIRCCTKIFLVLINEFCRKGAISCCHICSFVDKIYERLEYEALVISLKNNYCLARRFLQKNMYQEYL